MSSPSSNAAAAAAEDALKSARSSQRLSRTHAPGDARKFTLNREAAKRMRDAAIARALATWLTAELGREIRGEEPEQLAEDLESGVVFCELAARFGQITRYRQEPGNEFQRLENFEQFARAMSRLGLSAQPPPSRRGADVSQYIPCLLELAVLAKSHSERMDMDSTVPEDLIDQAEANAQQQPEPKEDKSVVRIDDLEKEVALAEEEEMEGMNRLLGQLHMERMQRQRAGPPKLRLIDVGARQLVCIERPGESMGSVVWPGSLDLIHYLHTSALRAELFNAAGSRGTILELGSGCGLCGVWCASEGSDVVVTDLPQSVDLLWANVAANAQQVVKAGGSCSARALDFGDSGQVAKLVRNLDLPLTVLAADLVYGEAVRPLLAGLRQILTLVPGARVLLAYKERDVLQEEAFFSALGEYEEVAHYPDSGCKIYHIRTIN